jgi:hypothetical protein
MDNSRELHQRIARLEAENARLRAPKKRPAEFSAHEDSYNGAPVLRFEGPTRTRPFSVGLSKLRAIKACWHIVDEFLRKYENTSRGTSCSGDDDSI